MADPFRSEDAARRLRDLRAENTLLRGRLVMLEAEAARWAHGQTWLRWGDTPQVARSTKRSTAVLGLAVVCVWLVLAAVRAVIGGR